MHTIHDPHRPRRSARLELLPHAARRAAAALPLALLLCALGPRGATAAAAPPAVGVVEKLGATIPAGLAFRDETGAPVLLDDLVDRPVILNLIYFRCPNICSPLVQEVARAVALIDLRPGVDFRLVTVSFDPGEGPDLAAAGKSALLTRTRDKYGKEIPADAWRFLTGTQEEIARLCEAVGFYYEPQDQDFNHAATTIFLSGDGKIVRYLNGLQLLPANVKLALIDAMAGRPRSVMQVVQALCFSYEADANTYVLRINRIILAVSVVILAVFLCFLLFFRRKPAGGAPAAEGRQ